MYRNLERREYMQGIQVGIKNSSLMNVNDGLAQEVVIAILNGYLSHEFEVSPIRRA